jgi:DNA-binding HxlR family transcriptional regulator
MATATQHADRQPAQCSIERTLDLIGDRWTFLVLRQVLLYRATRFTQFQRALGIAPNILTDRLEKLDAAGILEKHAYQSDGERSRFSYHPSPAGEKLILVLGALQQWGDENIPLAQGPSVLRRTAAGDPLHVAFVDDAERPVELDRVTFEFAPGFERPPE